MTTITEQFTEHLIERRRSSSTIKLRLVYIRQLEQIHPDLVNVSTRELEQFVYNERWTAPTVNTAVASVRAFYTWALASGRTATNPARDLQGLPVPRKPRAIARDIDIRRGLRTASIVESAMILLGSEGGLRRMEIATLHMRNRADDWLTVVGKGQRARAVFVTPNLKVALDYIERTQKRGYYFPGPEDGHVTGHQVYYVIEKHVGINPHALRHRAGTAVFKGSGNNIRVAQDFLGHASPATTAIYVHVEADELAAASRAAVLPPANYFPKPIAHVA